MVATQKKKKKGWLICLIIAAIVLTVVGCHGATENNNKGQESGSSTRQETQNSEDTSASIDPTQGGTIYCYYYSLLTAQEQMYYRKMYQAASTFTEKCELGGAADQETIEKILYSVMLDHPELFWIPHSYTYYAGNNAYISLEYTYTQAEAEDYLSVFSGEAATWAELCATYDYDDYQKVLCIYEYLIVTNMYDNTLEDARLVTGFLKGKTNCSGYANQMKYMLDALGVPCIYVSGAPIDGEGNGHAWNLVQMNGKWYHVDATWGDPSDEYDTFIGYTYMGLTDEEIYKDHHYSPRVATLPEANSTEDNYFRREGLYFETYSREALIPSLQKAMESGKTWWVRFSEQAYKEAMADLLDNKGVWELVKAAGYKANHISYNDYDDFYIFRADFSYTE